MWVFLSARLRTWLLLAIALPLARLLVHRLAVAAERHDSSARGVKWLRRADSAVTAVSGRFSRRPDAETGEEPLDGRIVPLNAALTRAILRCVALSPGHLATSADG